MKVWEQINSIVASLEEDLAEAKRTGSPSRIQQAQQSLDDFINESNAQTRD